MVVALLVSQVERLTLSRAGIMGELLGVAISNKFSKLVTELTSQLLKSTLLRL